MSDTTPPVILAIGGSDSGAAAGIQADLKAIAAHRGYATTVLTAVTAQNTTGVVATHPVPLETVAAQLEAVLSDYPVAAVKTGFLGRPGVVGTVTDRMPGGVPLVVDPVLVDSRGRQIVDDATVAAYRDLLAPVATLLTPNFREAALLSDSPVGDVASMVRAGRAIADRCGTAVLVTGGHLDGDEAVDVLVMDGEAITSTMPRLTTPNVHGTGCSTASAIATRMAAGASIREAVEGTRLWIHGAIAGASHWRLGAGQGGIDHFGWDQPSS